MPLLVSQIGVELVIEPQPDLRVGQLGAEIVIEPLPDLRVGQIGVEVVQEQLDVWPKMGVTQELFEYFKAFRSAGAIETQQLLEVMKHLPADAVITSEQLETLLKPFVHGQMSQMLLEVALAGGTGNRYRWIQ